MAETQRHAEFPPTKWSVIQKAAGASSASSHAALEDLCRAYWPPLYAFLRRSGHDPDKAKDLVQGYLARLLERGDLGNIGPEKGRFRSYLLSGLRNFLVSNLRHEVAQKRGGTQLTFSMDASDLEAALAQNVADTQTPDLAYDRQWAETILDHALEALEKEHTARGKGPLYALLKPVLTAETVEDYASLGDGLGMTPGAVAVAVHRLRLRLRALVRAEVAQSVGSEAELEEEMRSLFAALSG
ncbi:MAG TPA: sigma factor [Verrucomicrobiae bacterium]|nr:sigma factor [Verrucomicrobiae bacterium]